MSRHRRASIKRGKTARVYLLLILLASFNYAFDVIIVNNAFDFIVIAEEKNGFLIRCFLVLIDFNDRHRCGVKHSENLTIVFFCIRVSVVFMNY